MRRRSRSRRQIRYPTNRSLTRKRAIAVAARLNHRGGMSEGQQEPVFDAFQAATLEAIGRAVATTMRDQVLELVEENVLYFRGRDVARMRRVSRLVDHRSRALSITYLAIHVHIAGLPIKLIGGQIGKP